MSLLLGLGIQRSYGVQGLFDVPRKAPIFLRGKNSVPGKVPEEDIFFPLPLNELGHC